MGARATHEAFEFKEIATIGATTHAKNLFNKRKDRKEEKKEEIQSKPTEATRESYEFKEIATTGATTYADKLFSKKNKKGEKKEKTQLQSTEASQETQKS